jgi:O-antigen biosynthesis protein
MSTPIKVKDLELSDPPGAISGLEGYGFVQFLVRVHGTPLGYARVPVIGGCCTAAAIGQTVLVQHSRAIIRHLLNDALMAPPYPSAADILEILKTRHPVSGDASMPLVTVAVCTRDRTEMLRLCLEALNRLDYPNLDLIVIDNTPSTDDTRRLVTEHYSQMRYIREPRPGLSWARNRAIMEARSEIIAFVDDDVIVYPGWIKAFAAVFGENPEVMCVAGPVVPYELESEAQQLFERYGGQTSGFKRRWYQADIRAGKPLAAVHGSAGNFAGANMVYRRDIFERIGYFDPALGVGTVSIGGEDLEMFFRVLKGGYTLVYEPNAVVRHCHRRDYDSLRRQIKTWGTGFFPYIVSSAATFPDERVALIRMGVGWFYVKVRAVLASLMYPNRLRHLRITELATLLRGLFCYRRAQSIVAEIIKTYGTPAYLAASKKFISRAFAPNYKERTAVRLVDVAKPLQALADVADYSMTRCFVHCGDTPIGTAEISNLGEPIGVTRLREVLVEQFVSRLLDPYGGRQSDLLEIEALAALERHLVYDGSDNQMEDPECLPDDYTVSIIIATYDRPEDLRNCLRSLMRQKSTRAKEVIVVDNNPSSGLTPPVMTDFPQVILLNEPRQGTSYARNAGISASTGDFIVTLDDDEIVPPNWLERLLASFVRSDVMVVAGNVLPLELETPAQHLFEVYGAFNRGYEPFVADRAWFESSTLRPIPVWSLGGSGNAAFRAGIFNHPQIGMFDEALGPGTPTGSIEDLDMFYRVLKAGYTIIYEPKAYIFHKHRRSILELRQQIYNYAKGHVAYHLTTLIRDHDFRALVRLLIDLPLMRIKQVVGRFFVTKEYPLSMVLRDVAGNLAGPFALLRSRRRVRRLGASKPYVPVAERTKGELRFNLKAVQDIRKRG